VRPTTKELSELSTRERVAFELADLCVREPFTEVSGRYLATVMGTLIGSCGSRRIDVTGLHEQTDRALAAISALAEQDRRERG
jgi:hypothetical protein